MISYSLTLLVSVEMIMNIHYIFSFLGDSDMMVKYSYGQKSAQLLSSLNPDHHAFNTYKGLGHSSDPNVSD